MNACKGRRKEKEMGREQEKLVMVNSKEQAPKSEVVRTEHLCVAVSLSWASSGC